MKSTLAKRVVQMTPMGQWMIEQLDYYYTGPTVAQSLIR